MQKPPKITLMILFLSAKLQGTLVVKKKKKTMRRGYSGIFLLYVEKGFIGWFSQSSRWEVFWKIFSIKHFLGITWWHEKEKFYPKFFRFIETWYEGLNDLFGSALIITCVTVISTTKSKFIFSKLALLKI